MIWMRRGQIAWEDGRLQEIAHKPCVLVLATLSWRAGGGEGAGAEGSWTRVRARAREKIEESGRNRETRK